MVVEISTTPGGFAYQSSERNPIAGDEILDLRFASVKLFCWKLIYF